MQVREAAGALARPLSYACPFGLYPHSGFRSTRRPRASQRALPESAAGRGAARRRERSVGRAEIRRRFRALSSGARARFDLAPRAVSRRDRAWLATRPRTLGGIVSRLLTPRADRRRCACRARAHARLAR